MTGTRDECVKMALIAEKCLRWEDMVEYISRVAEAEPMLNAEERRILAAAYKGAISVPRSAAKVIADEIQKFPESTPPEVKNEAQEYLWGIEEAVKKHAYSIIGLVRDRLVAHAQTADEQVFYYKLQGDYYRYLSEINLGINWTPENQQEVRQGALTAYEAGTESCRSLPADNHNRLGLALNQGVFFWEILGLHKEAIRVTEQAVEAYKALDPQPLECADTTQCFELLQQNLKNWAPNHDGTGVEDL